MLVLGVETSCDETGIALVDDRSGLVLHYVYSQSAIHAEYGGVVPELASRDHIRKTLPLIKQLMRDAGMRADDIGGVAYTGGPGLIGALLVGAAIARSLAWGWQVPAIAVHHLEGHLLAPMLGGDKPDCPFLALLVSGGHTLLVKVTAVGRYDILGQSLDDAAGEAFDKTAKLLGLGYPGGPELAELAIGGNPKRFRFPRPMTDRPGLDFSFSGLKTHVGTTLRALVADANDRRDIARAFEDAVVDTLVIKCRRAIQHTGMGRLVVAGGVGANARLRQRLKAMAGEVGATVYYPEPAFCTDNGAMIAYAGLLRLQAGQCGDLALVARARWPLTELGAA